jgi:hypothetical protein
MRRTSQYLPIKIISLTYPGYRAEKEKILDWLSNAAFMEWMAVGADNACC